MQAPRTVQSSRAVMAQASGFARVVGRNDRGVGSAGSGSLPALSHAVTPIRDCSPLPSPLSGLLSVPPPFSASTIRSPRICKTTPEPVTPSLESALPVVDDTAEWRRRAISELEDYNCAPRPEHGLVRGGLDLLRWWQVCSHSLSSPKLCLTNSYLQESQTCYPYLFKVAMDVLAVQASSVSVERVFSAAADTDDTDRNRMQADL
jgi:hypothetical protein